MNDLLFNWQKEMIKWAKAKYSKPPEQESTSDCEKCNSMILEDAVIEYRFCCSGTPGDNL
jgi:hypothetical protein